MEKKKAFFTACYILCTLIPPPQYSGYEQGSFTPRMCVYVQSGGARGHTSFSPGEKKLRSRNTDEAKPTHLFSPVHLHERAGEEGEEETGAEKTHPVREREK